MAAWAPTAASAGAGADDVARASAIRAAGLSGTVLRLRRNVGHQRAIAIGLGHVAVGLFLGFLLGAVLGVAAMALGRAGRKTALPFGPFLAAGTLAAVFVGRWAIDRVWPD